MPQFDYEALDLAGRAKSGRLQADSIEAARADLLEKKLFATRLGPASGAAQPRALPARRRLKPRQLMLFTRQLATLAEVAPLAEALRTIARQADQPQVEAVLTRVHGAVVEGRRLADALALEPASFPPVYRAMVAAGESAGNLPDILSRLANLLERQAEIRSRLVGALSYPAALAVIALLAVAALMIFVVPRIAGQFEDLGQTLPLLTRIVMGISAFLAGWWWLLLALGVGGTLLFARALRDADFRLAFDTRLLALPVAGRVLRDVNAARLARTLAMMVASRLPIVEALALTAPTIGNHAMRAAATRMITAIREGASLSAAMRASSLFPPLLISMAAGGESAGRLDLMLERAAEALEREFDALAGTALAVLEPAIILVMGGLVAVIVLSILLPILQLETLAGA